MYLVLSLFTIGRQCNKLIKLLNYYWWYGTLLVTAGKKQITAFVIQHYTLVDGNSSYDMQLTKKVMTGHMTVLWSIMDMGGWMNV